MSTFEINTKIRCYVELIYNQFTQILYNILTFYIRPFPYNCAPAITSNRFKQDVSLQATI